MSKRKNTVLSLIFLLCCLLVVALFSLFTKNVPVLDTYITEDRITFTPDGSAEEVPLAVDLDAPVRLDGVYTSYYTIRAEKDGSFPLFVFSAGMGEVELSLDGRVLYSGTMSDADDAVSSPELMFSLMSGDTEKTLVAKVRYTNEQFYILPAVLRSPQPDANDRMAASLTNMAAIPAGIAGFSFLIIAALFLISLSLSNPDYSLLFLAFGIMGFCVLRLLDTGAAVCPAFLNLFREYVIPYVSLLLILIYIIWNRRKGILKYFLFFSGLLCVLVIAASVLKNLFDNLPSAVLELSLVANLLSLRQFNTMMLVASNYLVISCVAASLVYHIRNLTAIASEKASLENSARMVMAGYDHMVESMKETTAARHEWKHNLLTLSLLYEQGKIDEIGTYLKEKNDFIRANEWESFTGCFALDVILNFAAVKSKNEGIRLATHVNVPPELNIREDHLCQLLMNMFDNAFNACAAVQDDKFIDFTAELKNSCLRIRCSNSALPPSSVQSRPKDSLHGYGIKNMKKICQNYGSDLIIDTGTTGVFTVKTALQLRETEETASV